MYIHMVSQKNTAQVWDSKPKILPSISTWVWRSTGEEPPKLERISDWPDNLLIRSGRYTFQKLFEGIGGYSIYFPG